MTWALFPDTIRGPIGGIMLVKEVVRRVAEEVLAHRADCESAHMAEDDIWLDVLTYIACNSTDNHAAALAKAAIATKTVDFDRWYA